MARARMIANAVCADNRINELSDDTSRLAFTWLVTFADVEGRTYGDPAMIRSMLFPRRDDVSTAQVEGYIREWVAAIDPETGLGLVQWYEAKGDKWISFPNFAKNQPGLRRDHEPKSTIPAPPDGPPSTHTEPAEVRPTAGQDTANCPPTAGQLPAQVKLNQEKLTEGKARHGSAAVSPSLSGKLPDKRRADDDDPVVDRLTTYGITYLTANKLAAGHDALCVTWMDYADRQQNIPNMAAYLTGNIKLGKPPPVNGHGPPGQSLPRPSGLSEADLEVQSELQRATKSEKHSGSGPSPPTR